MAECAHRILRMYETLAFFRKLIVELVLVSRSMRQGGMQVRRKWSRGISIFLAAVTLFTAVPAAASQSAAPSTEVTTGTAETQPQGGQAPSGEAQPQGGQQPSGNTQPQGGQQPSGETQPQVGQQPSGETQPQVGQQPSGEAQPQGGQTTNQNIQGEQVQSPNIQGEQVPDANVQGEQVPNTSGDQVTIQKDDRPYLSLGADLTEEQRAAVLGLMGIDPAGLANYDVVYVTNQEEHQYLGAYIDASKIGNKAWSSIVIVDRKPGSGLNISTSNITYCTVGMYKNALATAGITDADIIVAGPKPISGTAALVGIFKAYGEMTGKAVDDTVIDAALNELVVTGELAASIEGLTNEEVEEFIAYIKSVIAQNDFSDAENINKVIDEACEKYGVTLSDAERQQIVDLLLKITSLGIDLSGLVDYAESLYNSFRDGGGDGILSAIGDFFVRAFEAIADFFKSLFS